MSSLQKSSSSIDHPIIGEIIAGLSADETSLLADGFLACDGSLVSKTTYSSLSSAIGTIATDFNNNVWNTANMIGSVGANSLVYGNGMFVGSLESAGTTAFITSTNATNWVGAASVITAPLSVMYNDGHFYAVFTPYAGIGWLGTSTNANNWQYREPQTTTTLSGIVYGNGLYVYGGLEGTFGYSTDASNWEVSHISTDSQHVYPKAIRSLLYANSKLILGGNSNSGGIRKTPLAGANTGYLSTTTDMLNYNPVSVTTTGNINALLYSGSLYVYGDGKGAIGTSTNSSDWTKQLVTSKSINALAYGNNTYVLATSDNSLNSIPPDLMTSTNASNWTSRTINTISTINELLWNGSNTFIYVSDNDGVGGINMQTSTNAINWTDRNSNSGGSHWYALAYNGTSTYVVAGNSGKLNTSVNLGTWTSRSSGTTSAIMGLAYGNGIFVYGGVGGAIGTSTNAVNWSPRVSGTTESILSLIYDGSKFVFGTGYRGTVGSSTDAINWTLKDGGFIENVNTLAYGNGIFVAGADYYGGMGGTVKNLLTSTNGNHWTVVSSGSTNSIRSVIYGDGRYVYADAKSGGVQLHYSYDAINWSTVTSATLSIGWSSAPRLAFGAGLYVYGNASPGSDPFLSTSTNLIDWTISTILPITAAGVVSAITYGNGYFVAAGSALESAYMDMCTYNQQTDLLLPNLHNPTAVSGDNSLKYYIKASQ